MNKVIWRAYRLGDLFGFSSGNTFALKNYNILNEKGSDTVEIVTSSKDNNIDQFISKSDIPNTCPIYEKSLTINRNGSIGYCHYHKGEFIIPTGDSYALIHKNNSFKETLSTETYSFLSILITRLFAKTSFGYSYKVNSERFDREIILLPCLEVSANEDYIWEENGKHYTLAVDYIKRLMDEAKELREQKTIRLYEAERAKYEAERAKYEAEYQKEKAKVIWKSYKLDDLFSRTTPPSTGVTAKELSISEKPSERLIPLITRAETNNGIRGYIEKENYPTAANAITYNDQFSFFLYHDYEFTTIKDHLSIVKAKNSKLQLLLDDYNYVNFFIVTILNHIFSKDIFNFNFTGAEYRFGREIIILPCLEVSANEDYIWEENGKYYTLAVNYISYIYLTGRINYDQKLIDNYTYQY